MLIVATAVLVELHVPPGWSSLKDSVPPGQRPPVPLIEPADVGAESTVIGNIADEVPQLLVSEYDTVAVPAVSPVTTPVPLTVAMVASLMSQVPPLTVSVKVLGVPRHILEAPDIAPELGNG